jgi:putative colanic acid biosynthesis UDP-glucose lipid carrier transferase
MLATNPATHATATRESERRASLVRWTHGLVNRIVMVIDAAVLLGSTFIYWLATPAAERPFTWLQAGAVAVIIVIGSQTTMRWTRAYRVERYGRLRRSLPDICAATLLADLPALVVVLAFLPNLEANDDWLVGWGLATLAGVIAGRLGARLLVDYVQARGLLRRRVIVVGNDVAAEQIVRRLRDPGNADSYQLLGVIDPVTNRLSREAGETGAPRSAVDVTRYAQNYAVDLVIIALPWERSVEIFALTRRLQWIAADVVVPFVAAGLRPQFAPPMEFTAAPVLQLMARPFKGTQGLVKILEDYVVAIVGLIVASPFMLGAVIAIRLEGSGPIFFCQPRVGFNSKPFKMLKFRTMTVDPADDGSRGTARDSARITRVGRFLRRTSIDELPQLINVLRGEMSIVGPRPHVPNMLVGEGVYSEVVQQYAARHRIKPGITGWAQINGMRGGINSVEKAARGAELDLYYVANWSPKLDIKIMLRTLVGGLMGRNVF